MGDLYPIKEKELAIFSSKTNKGGPTSLDFLMTLQNDDCKTYYQLLFSIISKASYHQIRDLEFLMINKE